MADGKAQIDELAALIKEFDLAEATWESEGIRVSFKKKRDLLAMQMMPSMEYLASGHAAEADDTFDEPAHAVVEVPAGAPVTSPMNGIFYNSPSPNASPFVKEGDTVTAGQVVALIEAMKVFNEIVSNFSGVVRKVTAETGAVVQPGEVLMYIG